MSGPYTIRMYIDKTPKKYKRRLKSKKKRIQKKWKKRRESYKQEIGKIQPINPAYFEEIHEIGNLNVKGLTY